MSIRKAVVITGASSGIGKSTAVEFSRQGYFVYLLGRNKEKLESVGTELTCGARRYGVDLKDLVAVKKVAQDIIQQADTEVEILINNAGMYRREDFTATDLSTWSDTFSTNLFGPVALTYELLPTLIKNRGSVVNVASTLGLRPIGDAAAYSASKAALINWTQCLALQVAPQGVRVNVICPGFVDTPIHPPGLVEKMKSAQPLGRVGKPEEIAKSIFFMASQNSSWTTGAILSVDGGIQIS